MEFDFFEKLSSDEANAYLKRFLSLESERVDETLRECAAGGSTVDYSIGSIAPFMQWAAGRLKTIPQAPDTALPEWIRDVPSYTKNLFQFDEPSAVLMLRVAYYLGESFVRNHKTLRWSIGDPKTAEANMPVVAGFKSRLEMAPILITENLIRRIICDPSKLGDVAKAIGYWNQKA